MKYFGTVKSFDTALGHGEIKPETGGADLSFDKAAISWGKENPPTVGQRLSYDVGPAGAINLQTI